MEAFNQFFTLFQEIWFQGIFGINVSEIIIGLIILSNSFSLDLSELYKAFL